MFPFASLIRNKERKKKKKGQRLSGREETKGRKKLEIRERQERRGEEERRERERELLSPQREFFTPQPTFVGKGENWNRMMLFCLYAVGNTYLVVYTFYSLQSIIYFTFHTQQRKTVECF